jgi:hypothetical protein
MVEQLFTSLDEDCDGKIGLEDFLELFVGQNGCGNGTNDLFGQASKTQQRINERLSLSPSVEVSFILQCTFIYCESRLMLSLLNVTIA